jgi:hypothetical protein
MSLTSFFGQIGFALCCFVDLVTCERDDVLQYGTLSLLIDTFGGTDRSHVTPAHTIVRYCQ